MHHRSGNSRWWFLLLAAAVVYSSEIGIPDTHVDVDESKYLYQQNAEPVIEYMTNETSPTEGVQLLWFLSSPTHLPTVVLFYAPWCPHCRLFRNRYVSIANQTTGLARNHGARTEIEFYAISCVVHSKLCHHYGINGYPQMRLAMNGSAELSPMLGNPQMHPFALLSALGVESDQSNVDTSLESKQKMLQSSTKRALRSNQRAGGIVLTARTKQQTFDDAFLSLDFVLRQSVYEQEGLLYHERKMALLEWMDLLQRTLPPTWRVHRHLIRPLLKNFEFASQSEDHLLRILNENRLATDPAWSEACTNGFTCGLWQLFHILSVGLVEYNSLLEWDNWKETISPASAAECIRRFIGHFFGCEVCRTHFEREYSECALDRCNRLKYNTREINDWKEFVLWLYETHNAVRVRLFKEQASREGKLLTDREEERQRWPSVEECALCWKEDGTFDKEAIYKYLRIQYWPDDETTVLYRKELNLGSTVPESKSQPSNTLILPAGTLVTLAGLLGVAISILLWFHRMDKDAKARHKKTDE